MSLRLIELDISDNVAGSLLVVLAVTVRWTWRDAALTTSFPPAAS